MESGSGKAPAAAPSLAFQPGLASSTLANRRRQLRWSQADLAAAAGVSRPLISMLESGKCGPSSSTRAALGRALGVEPEELFALTLEPGGHPQLRVQRSGAALHEARLARGLSQYELARLANVTQGHISGLEGWEGWHARPPAARRISNALGLALEDIFEQAPSAGQAWRTQPFATPLEHGGVREARDYALSRGYWLIVEAGDFLNVRERTVHAYVEKGLLKPVDRRIFGGINFAFFEPREVKAFARARFKSSDGRVARFYHGAEVFKQSIARGLTMKQAEAAEERAEARRADDARIRVGKRQPAPVSERDAPRWARLLDELKSELADHDESPTRQELLVQVALVDWAESPAAWRRDRWPGDSCDLGTLDRREYRSAAARIRRALADLSE